MPRLPRIHLEGAIYFVTSRGQHEQVIFKERADYQMYLDLVAKYKSQHKFKLYSYSLLPDRLHLLIETGDDATISEIMHDLNSLYTKYFNGKYDRRGHLFESRFKSVLVEKAAYLASMSRHIHGLIPADALADFPYTSYAFYVDPHAKGLDIASEVAEIVEFVKNHNNGATYEKYCLEGGEEAESLAKALKRGGVVGTE